LTRAPLLLALVLPGLGVGPSPTTDERLLRVEERKKALEAELGRLRGEEKGLLVDVERLTVGVRLKAEELRESELVLQKANGQMDETLARVRKLEKSVAEVRPILAARARDLYKLGELSYVRMLLSVDHPSDFFRGYRFVTALARRDNERISAFRQDLRNLAATRDELQKRTRQALATRAEADEARRNFEEERRRKGELLTSIVEKKELHAAYVHELEEAEGRLKALLAGLEEGDVAIPLPAFKGSLPWPVAGRIKVPFGKRRHKFETYTIENGVEIETTPEAPVGAIHEGTVVFADRFQGYGLLVVLDHGARHYSLYGHLGEIAVKTGDRVTGGAPLGRVGTEPGSDLYFEIRFQEQAVDPAEWLKKPEGPPARLSAEER
jgi:septal ring factor EnvC (AmiA/AmiB activator)